jgi:hypothetical protein
MYLINLNIFQNRNEKQEFIDRRDNQGYTALHLGVLSKSERIVRKLLQSGASSDIVDNNNRTPLDLAITKEYNNIIEMLKNNQSFQICNYEEPIKPIKKSSKPIILVFCFQFVTTLILYFSLIPIALPNNNENNIINTILFFIYKILLLLFLILYGILLRKDPGEIRKNDINKLKELLEKEIDENKSGGLLDLKKYCYKCFIKKSKNSKHCIVCDKCYDDFKHHCFWINKCIAKRNYNLFISFLFTTFLYLFLLLIICILGLYNFFVKNLNENCFEFLFIKIIYLKNIFGLGDNTRYFHFVLIIVLLLIILVILVPEFILLSFSVNDCCNNLRIKRYIRNKEINTTPLVDSFDENSIDE